MAASAWQDRHVAEHFVDARRDAMPFGVEQFRLMLRLVQCFIPRPRRILDLGCGDGIVARTLLDAYPDATALLLDNSEPMLERARTAMAAYGNRCIIRLADLNEPLSAAVCEPVDVVASGYAIHHLTDERKRTLYAGAFDVLALGGLFVNIEHVASVTPHGEALFDEAFIDYVAGYTQRDRTEAAAEHHARPDKADNILTPVETQLGWLREIGFAEVDCYFKWLELAVFAGVKPRE